MAHEGIGTKPLPRTRKALGGSTVSPQDQKLAIPKSTASPLNTRLPAAAGHIKVCKQGWSIAPHYASK